MRHLEAEATLYIKDRQTVWDSGGTVFTPDISATAWGQAVNESLKKVFQKQAVNKGVKGVVMLHSYRSKQMASGLASCIGPWRPAIRAHTNTEIQQSQKNFTEIQRQHCSSSSSSRNGDLLELVFPSCLFWLLPEISRGL